MKKIILYNIICILFILPSLVTIAQNESGPTSKKLVTFNLSEGISTSNDYKSSLINYYSGSSGFGLGWWEEIDLGLNFNFTDHLTLTAKADVLFSKIQTYLVGNGTATPGGEGINLLVLPGLLAKYYFNFGPTNSIYLSAGLSKPIWSSDISDFAETKGTAAEGYIAYEKTLAFRQKKSGLKRGTSIGIRLGYRSIPMSVQNNNTQSGYPTYQSANFGGYSFAIYQIF